MEWQDLTVLITGGTGSFGKKFVDVILKEYNPKKVIIFSRDELKQHEMRVNGFNDPRLRYFIGDVRDKNRLLRAFRGVDVVVHAAALKQVPSCEYNPIEAVSTNIDGAKNIIDAALDSGVKKILAISTDKATDPVNLYGATKLVAEKLFIQANSYSGENPVQFSCVRYGNVIGSRGSVIPLFKEQRKLGKITLTDKNMTRFWITLDQGVRFVISCIERMYGGEIFVPKIPSMTMMDLAKTLAPNCEIEVIGIRPGEKLHEKMISDHEVLRTADLEDRYVILPAYTWWNQKAYENYNSAKKLSKDFVYSSDTNDKWLTPDELLEMVGEAQCVRI